MIVLKLGLGLTFGWNSQTQIWLEIFYVEQKLFRNMWPTKINSKTIQSFSLWKLETSPFCSKQQQH